MIDIERDQTKAETFAPFARHPMLVWQEFAKASITIASSLIRATSAPFLFNYSLAATKSIRYYII